MDKRSPLTNRPGGFIIIICVQIYMCSNLRVTNVLSRYFVMGLYLGTSTFMSAQAMR